ncbi:unnamed protein product [Pylaiella littoralis]
MFHVHAVERLLFGADKTYKNRQGKTAGKSLGAGGWTLMAMIVHKANNARIRLMLVRAPARRRRQLLVLCRSSQSNVEVMICPATGVPGNPIPKRARESGIHNGKGWAGGEGESSGGGENHSMNGLAGLLGKVVGSLPKDTFRVIVRFLRECSHGVPALRKRSGRASWSERQRRCRCFRASATVPVSSA